MNKCEKGIEKAGYKDFCATYVRNINICETLSKVEKIIEECRNYKCDHTHSFYCLEHIEKKIGELK